MGQGQGWVTRVYRTREREGKRERIWLFEHLEKRRRER